MKKKMPTYESIQRFDKIIKSEILTKREKLNSSKETDVAKLVKYRVQNS